jgi:putative ABC transport system permease protein
MSPGLTEQNYLEVRRQNRSFEQIATFNSLPDTLTGAGEPLRIPGATVTPGFFTVLRVNPSIGRTFLAGEDQPGRNDVAILSDALWRTRFGADFRVIGKTITLDGIARTVVGVMPAGFGFPNDAQVWTPLAIRIDPHTSILRPVVGRLKPGVSPQEASSEFEALIAGVPPPPDENRNDWTVSLLPLKELLVSDIRMSLLIFSGAVAFVLLIACANVANLMLMRAASRRQELAVRAALGAGRWRLIRLFLTESILISIGGACAGMILALWAVPLLLALAPAGRIPRISDIRIDGWVLASTLAISVLTGIVSGLAPALRMTRGQASPSSSLGTRSGMGRRERLRAVLVVAEVALALVLLTGAGLMLKSFLRLRAVDPGFRPDKVLTMTVDLPPSLYETSAQIHPFYERTLSKLSHLPGVVAAGAVNWRPLGGALIIGDFQIEGGRPLPKD